MDNKELITAIADGQLERVREMIDSKDLESLSKLLREGELLGVAIKVGQKKVVKLLLDKGAKVNIPGEVRCWRHPLRIAVDKRDTEVVQMLLEKGAKIEAKDMNGQTTLNRAIALGDIDMVRLLLDNRANVYDSYFEYSSALDEACQRGNRNIMELLIGRGVKLGKNAGSKLKNVNTEYINDDDVDLSPLHAAVQRGYTYLVEHYLKRGSNVNSICNLPPQKGHTPLHSACENRKKEIVEMLLYHGANVDAQDEEGRTALYLAAENGDSAIVRVILRYRPDTSNDGNRRSLKAAVCGSRRGDRDSIVKNLILYGFTTNTENMDGKVLHEAVRKGFYIFLVDFLEYNNVNSAYRDTLKGKEDYTLLHTACENNGIEIIKHLLFKGADVNSRTATKLTPLHVAIRSRYKVIVDILLSRGANVDDEDNEGNTALYFAVRTGLLLIVKGVLEYKPDVNLKGNKKSLCAAFNYNDSEMIMKVLFRYGFTITSEDADDYRLLHQAVVMGETKVVRDLLKYITEEHISRYECEVQGTPLHFAALNKRKGIVKLLLDAGADTNALNFEGVTPIYSVIFGTTEHIKRNSLKSSSLEFKRTQTECMEIVELLLKHGADPKIRDSEGMTVLHYTSVAKEGMEEIAKFLLKLGADVTVAGKDGVTALSNATYNGNRSLARLFLEHGGLDFSREIDRKILEYATRQEYYEYFYIPIKHNLADINSVDVLGNTALQFAYENKHDELLIWLLTYGADINAGNKEWLQGVKKNTSLAAELIKIQVSKLKIAGLKVPDCCSLLEYTFLSVRCRKELQEMRDKKISRTTVSFRDILTNDLDQLAAYAENEDIADCLESNGYQHVFVLYYYIIKGCFYRGVVRRGLLPKAIEIFRNYCEGLPELPHVCVKRIFTFLTDQDLRGLIRSNEEYR